MDTKQHRSHHQAFLTWAYSMLIVFLGLFNLPVSANETTLIPALKAAYIFNFTQFIQWPESAFASASAPFQICVVGRSPIYTELSQLSDHSYGDHEFVITSLAADEDSGGCKLIYIDPLSEPGLRMMLKKNQARPVLTISSKPGFVDLGGMIGFIRKGDHLRFEVNHSALRFAGLAPRATLLEVAERVTDTHGTILK